MASTPPPGWGAPQPRRPGQDRPWYRRPARVVPLALLAFLSLYAFIAAVAREPAPPGAAATTLAPERTEPPVTEAPTTRRPATTARPTTTQPATSRPRATRPPTTMPRPTSPPTTLPRPVTTRRPAPGCDPSYPGVCLRVGIGDYDCEGGSGNGPNYVRGPIRVRPPDPFDLDREGDGTGCES